MALLNTYGTNIFNNYKQVTELSQQYQHIFSDFQSFNLIQSQLMDEILSTDSPVVVSAPTGSGKTVLFEFAIIRLLEKCQRDEDSPLINKKILYLAPVKALCTERFNDWEFKFRKLGLKAIEVTGDSDEGNLLALQHFNLVLSTPEKWDSLTRKWRDHTSLVEVIKLILIDEVHLLNEEKRGSTLEAVVSRMKTIQESSIPNDNHIRFIAVSATIPNIEDVASWLGKKNHPAKYHKFGEEMRPVRLNKIVKTYPFKGSMSYFKFDLSLSYKLKQIILDHAEGKPALIFCSTRKAVLQTSTTLLQNITFHFNPVQKMTLEEAREGLLDSKLKDMVKYGVGFHHAGLSVSDRHNMEELFKSGFLPILVSTSTLAMGVNLPAHLVIIKSTAQYVNGSWEEYSEGQILQMMGRAGRPQFDDSATAVILTKDSLREKYEKLVSGNDVVESNLHKNLAEHLNSEIVLGTITDIAVAVHWIRSTFLYIRAVKNPKRYGIPEGLSSAEMETRLQAMCMRELNGLEKYELIKKTDFAYNVEPTENGKLMARLYIAFETMKLFMKVKGTETIPQMLEVISQCHEFADVHLRINERTTLNRLNKDKTHETIRYSHNGRITTKEMKINCLIQATLGCLQIQDISLAQEGTKIIRIAERLLTGLSLYLWQKNWYEGLASALILSKSIKMRMWENSCYMSRQLPGIGPALASLLAAAKKTTFKSIIESNPRDLERIINKHPPMGNSIQEAARSIPQYSLELNYQEFSKKLYICLKLLNCDKIIDDTHTFSLLVAGCNNELLRKETIRDGYIIDHKGELNFTVQIQPEMNIEAIIVHVISNKLVGVDVKKVVAIFSKYQFFSQNEADNFYSEEESLESSEKSYDERQMSIIPQKKNPNKLSQKKRSPVKRKTEKGVLNVKSKYQTNLSKYVFKSTQPQFKHVENERSSSDNEVSSTQDIMKFNSPPTSVPVEKYNDIENKYSTNISVNSNNSKLDKRLKIDMEYKWYIEKNIEISTKTHENEIITKVVHNANLINNSTAESRNHKSPYIPITIQNSNIIATTSNTTVSKYNINNLEQYVSDLEKTQFLTSVEKQKHAYNPEIKENYPNFCNTSSTFTSPNKIQISHQNTNNHREPLVLSPQQFLKNKKHIPQKTNNFTKTERNYFPLFMPFDSERNKMETSNEDVKTIFEVTSNKGTQDLPDVDVNNVILTSKVNTLTGKISPLKKNPQKRKRQKFENKYRTQTTFNTSQKGLQDNSADGEIINIKKLNSENSSSNKEILLKTYQVQSEQNSLVFEKINRQNNDISYSQLDDLFHDSPENKEIEAINVLNPCENIKVVDTSRRSSQIEDSILLQMNNNMNTKNVISPNFDVRDFTRKQLNFGESTSELEELNTEEELEAYNDNSDDSNSEKVNSLESLRSDYGNPFAPAHNSVVLQRLNEKSKKENITNENYPNPSFYYTHKNLELQNTTDSYRSIYTKRATVSPSETISKKKQSTKNLRSSCATQNYSNLIENPTYKFSPPECSNTKKSELKCQSIKHFFPIQKEIDPNQDYSNSIFNERNILKEQSGIQSHASVKQHSCVSHNYKPFINFQEHKEPIDFNKFPSPEKIQMFKKNMLQNSIFSQKSKTIKLPKSANSENTFPRLSNLLCSKRGSFDKSSMYNFQSASNLINAKKPAFHLVPPEDENWNNLEINRNIYQENTSNHAHTSVVNPKPISNMNCKYNFNASTSRLPQSYFSPQVLQTHEIENNNFPNDSMRQNYYSNHIGQQMVEHQKYVNSFSESPDLKNYQNTSPPSGTENNPDYNYFKETSPLFSQVFKPISSNELDISPLPDTELAIMDGESNNFS